MRGGVLGVDHGVYGCRPSLFETLIEAENAASLIGFLGCDDFMLKLGECAGTVAHLIR
ncbi:hypothetical protein D9M69_735420 [compost metagenome]